MWASLLNLSTVTDLADGNPWISATRGENANINLLYAVVGWAPTDLGTGGSESLVVGSGPVWHEGRVLAEYVSSDGGGNDNGNGLLRMEIGVKRQWVE